MKHLPLFILIVSLILASCAPGSGVQDIPLTPSMTATGTAAPLPTYTPSATTTPKPLTADDFNAELAKYQAQIERDLGVKVDSFHDYSGGNDVPAGIYAWSGDRAVAVYNLKSGEFVKYNRPVSVAYFQPKNNTRQIGPNTFMPVKTVDYEKNRETSGER